MTATDAPDHRRRQLAARAAPVAGLPARCRSGRSCGRRCARWGDRTAFIDHDVPLTFTELGARAHAVAGVAGRPRRRPRRRRRRPHPQLPAVPAALLRHPAGRGDLLPHQPAAAGGRTWPRSSPTPGATVLITWDQVLPVRPRRAGRRRRCETVVVTGEAHTLDFAARLEGLEDGEIDARRRCSPATRPTGTWTPASTRPPTSRTSPTPAARPGVSKGVELPHRNVVTNVLQSACWTSGSLPDARRGRRRDAATRSATAEEYRTRLGSATAHQPDALVPRHGRDRLPQRHGDGRHHDRHPHALRPGQVRRGRRPLPGHRHRRRPAGLRRAAAGARASRRPTCPASAASPAAPHRCRCR